MTEANPSPSSPPADAARIRGNHESSHTDRRLTELSVLTLNVGSAAEERAGRIWQWLAKRHEDLLVLTEVRSVGGTAKLIDQFRRSGYSIAVNDIGARERGVAIVSRIALEPLNADMQNFSFTSRVVATRLATVPTIDVLGLYVPARSQDGRGLARKQRFISAFLAVLSRMTETTQNVILAGDYNTISRRHNPPLAEFQDFELDLIDSIEGAGFTDAFFEFNGNEQPYSWTDSAGNPLCLDYFHVTNGLRQRVVGCEYLAETRKLRLTDHSAVSLNIEIEAASRRPLRTGI